ncbi:MULTISPECIES: flagellar hook protein FlgE [Xanthobacter]|uniref:flagellar hook protein FlgE n=1 Tax=Xanthobacter TaxID=279 RepID=UPI001F389B0A|nr:MULTISPECIES: flagellar hook protein FlgE [unclassified Xanthobacter]
MSLYGMMRTSVSGMNAQANLLSTVGDNIANSGTIGYKAASADFSSVMLQSETGSGGDYQSGSVKTTISYDISARGELDYTGKGTTDLAIQGNGFFLVTDTSGQTVLTRAGNFTQDASTNNLVNGAGYTLMGYAVAADGTVDSTQLVPVNIDKATVTAAASTDATFAANLPTSAAIGDTMTTSLTAYDALGSQRNVSLTMEKTAVDATTGAVTWTVTASGDVDPATYTLTFDSSGVLTTSPATFSLAVQNSLNATTTTPVTLDLSGMVQKDMDYTPLTTDINGSSASVLSDISIDGDGTVYAVNGDGDQFAIFKIPLGYVTSPDNLTPLSGNAYQINNSSGPLQIGYAESAGLGTMVSGATEGSTVDTASELTTMIVAQRDYTANSKVFQTGTELLDVLMNLKR